MVRAFVLLCVLALVAAGPARAQELNGRLAFLARQLEKASDPHVRAMNALLLGAARDPAAVRPLCLAFGDESELVRTSVAKALGQLGEASAADCLKARRNDSAAAVRAEVERALKALEAAAAHRWSGRSSSMDPARQDDPAFEAQIKEQSEKIERDFEREKDALVAQRAALVRQKQTVWFVLVACLVGFVLFIGLATIVTTHRMVGSLFRIKHEVNAESFQLKLTANIVAIGLCVATILGGFLWNTSKRLLEEAEVAVASRQKAAEMSKELSKATLSNLVMERALKALEARAAPPPELYISMSPVADRSAGLPPELLQLADERIRARIQAMGGVFAPEGESSSAARLVLKRQKLKGFMLRVELDSTPSGGLKVSLLCFTYPGRNLLGEVNVKASGAKAESLIRAMAPKVIEEAAETFDWSS